MEKEHGFQMQKQKEMDGAEDRTYEYSGDRGYYSSPADHPAYRGEEDDFQSYDKRVDRYAHRGPEISISSKSLMKIFVQNPWANIRNWAIRKSSSRKPRGIQRLRHLSGSSPADFKAPSNSLFPENPVTDYGALHDLTYGEDTMTQIEWPTQFSTPNHAIMVLAQGSRGSLPEAELNHDGHVRKLRRVRPTESPIVSSSTEFDQFKFMRLSSEPYPDLKGPQLEFLSDLCHAAHRSQKFFLSIATNQWVLTSITSDLTPLEIFSRASTVEEHSEIISSITIHSNVLPRDPFWIKLGAMRGGRKPLQFPCFILKEALAEEKSLNTKLLEWREKGDESKIAQPGLKISVDGNKKKEPRRLLWEISPEEVETFGFDVGNVSLVTWRGGKFVRKVLERTSYYPDVFDPELNVVKRLSHPHIVYTFGVSYEAPPYTRSLFMEYMQTDLRQILCESVDDEKHPPFSHQESVGILLQVAKAMAYMQEEDVVHGDLKPGNILISEFMISDNVRQYLVKVTDFSCSQFFRFNSVSKDFRPHGGTLFYAAPEVLKSRRSFTEVTLLPNKIDVYSFGIVAFEVLTGATPYENIHRSAVMEGVMVGALRPPLRAKCRRNNFLKDERLISLIESCWHHDPSKRPFFWEIVQVLDSVSARFLV